MERNNKFEVVGWKKPELLLINPELFSHCFSFEGKTMVHSQNWQGFVAETLQQVEQEYFDCYHEVEYKPV